MIKIILHNNGYYGKMRDAIQKNVKKKDSVTNNSFNYSFFLLDNFNSKCWLYIYIYITWPERKMKERKEREKR